MADVQVLDKSIVNLTMTPKILTQQSMYSYNIPTGTLSNESRLRIKLTLSRVVGTPLNNTNFACDICHDDAKPGAQELSEVKTIIANQNETAGSFSFIDDINGEAEIYQAVYVPADALSGTFDNNTGLKLYKIRESDTTQIAKILTTTDDDLNSGSLTLGVSDEPAYAIYFLVSFSSTAPAGLYLYRVNSREQYYFPTIDSSYGYFALANNKVYLIADSATGTPTNIIRKFELNGTVINSSNALPNAGYTNVRAYQIFGNYLWVLSQNTIIKLDTTNLAIVAQYPLGKSPCRAFTVVSENLIYFYYGNISIAYLDLGNGQVTDVDVDVTKTTALSFNDGTGFPIRFNMFFKKIDNNPGYIYLGSESTPHILKIGPIGCP